MANQPLGFAEIFAGGILLIAGISGDSIGNVVKGTFQWPPKPWGTSGIGAQAQAQATSGSSNSSSPADAGKIMSDIATSKGWTSAQLQDWKNVIGAEDASYSLTAKNPTSTAYGIAQFINGPSEYYTWGGDPGTVQGQLTAMANYISSRYGDPSSAWSFHLANGYY
jgi:hypothetical protein